jgi:hypothetical protein
MKSLHFAYGQIAGVAELTENGAIVVTGRGNRYHADFQTARKRGVPCYAYLNPINIPVGSTNPQDLEQWVDTATVPRWRFNGTGPVRSTWENTELADIRPGSPWRLQLRKYCEMQMRNGLFDGFFCDDTGARPWGKPLGVAWTDWPMAEQQLWVTCMLDLAREIHQIRLAVRPQFELVHNNLWHLPSGHPAAAIAATGDQYCNGVCLENTNKVLEEDAVEGALPDKPSQFHINYASRAFGMSAARRLFVIAPDPAFAVEWMMVPGVTHIALVDKTRKQTYLRSQPSVADQIRAIDATAKAGGTGSTAELEQLRAQLTTAQSQLAASQATIQTLSNDVSILKAEVGELVDKVTVERQKLARIHAESAPA